MSREVTNAVKYGSLSVTWKDGGSEFEYSKDGKRFRYDIAARKADGTHRNFHERFSRARAATGWRSPWRWRWWRTAA
jgi:dipeptidyl-peptidase-4